jgi:branched-subunit amino acid ABC-type transport system permease component
MLAVMLGVVLAGLAGVMGGVRGMAVRRMGVMGGFLVRIRFVMLGGLAMMLGCVLVMLGRGVVMLYDLVLGHDALQPLRNDYESVATSQL